MFEEHRLLLLSAPAAAEQDSAKRNPGSAPAAAEQDSAKRNPGSAPAAAEQDSAKRSNPDILL